MTTTSLTFEVPIEQAAELKRFADLAGLPPSALLEEALETFLLRRAREIADIEEGIAELERGEGIPHEEIEKWVASWGTENELPPPR